MGILDVEQVVKETKVAIEIEKIKQELIIAYGENFFFKYWSSEEKYYSNLNDIAREIYNGRIVARNIVREEKYRRNQEMKYRSRYYKK